MRNEIRESDLPRLFPNEETPYEKFILFKKSDLAGGINLKTALQ